MITKKKVSRIREFLGLNQKRLGLVLGYKTGQMVSHWESGRKICSGPSAVLLEVLEFVKNSDPKIFQKIVDKIEAKG